MPVTSRSTNACESAHGTSQPSCRPWEKEDILRRLSTFVPSKWIAKPKATSSFSCAQRGWVNVDINKIECECCGAGLSFDLLPTWTHAQAEQAGEAFASQLNAGHNLTCPWREETCPESLVQFLPTHQSALIGGYNDRRDGLLQFKSLPIISSSTIEKLRISNGAQIDRFLSQLQSFAVEEVNLKSKSEQELENSRDDAFCVYSRALMILSLCGWEPRWLPNVQDCEEHSAQSAKIGGSFGPTWTHSHMFQNHGPSKNGLSSRTKIERKKNKGLAVESRYESRSPLLDCGLCGATVKILDFLTVRQPSSLVPTSTDIPDTGGKMALTRGISAASGINCEQIEDHDEVATSKRTFVPNSVDLNITMPGVSSCIQVGKPETLDNILDVCVRRDVVIRQFSDSEIGGGAASLESRGASSRKRSLEKGGSSDYRADMRMRQVDSLEATVIDRDNDEVTDERQFSAGPSKRVRDSDIFDTYCSPPQYQMGSSVAGPSFSKGLSSNKISLYRQESDRNLGAATSTRDSARASSVIAMDTVLLGGDDNSDDSVENYRGDIDDAINFPSSSIYENLDMIDTSELNYSNPIQQSSCFLPGTELAPGDIGVSSTNDGEEIFNADASTPCPRDGISFGISGGSVGMCASHEAEIHGTDVCVHRGGSFLDDVEPKVDDVENQGQTGESAAGTGVIIEELVRLGSRDDSHEMSVSIARADSGSKVDGSIKAESLESGEKISQRKKLPEGDNNHHQSVSCNLVVNSPSQGDNNHHQSVSCNAVVYSEYATSKDVTGPEKNPILKESLSLGSDFVDFVATAIGTDPPKGESNYEEGNYEAKEFDPIIHHNIYCPWVNGNVAAAGYLSSGSDLTSEICALSGWQLTLGALDAIKSQGNYSTQLVPSDSAASLYKDDLSIPGRQFLQPHSFSQNGPRH